MAASAAVPLRATAAVLLGARRAGGRQISKPRAAGFRRCGGGDCGVRWPWFIEEGIARSTRGALWRFRALSAVSDNSLKMSEHECSSQGRPCAAWGLLRRGGCCGLPAPRAAAAARGVRLRTAPESVPVPPGRCLRLKGRLVGAVKAHARVALACRDCRLECSRVKSQKRGAVNEDPCGAAVVTETWQAGLSAGRPV